MLCCNLKNNIKFYCKTFRHPIFKKLLFLQRKVGILFQRERWNVASGGTPFAKGKDEDDQQRKG